MAESKGAGFSRLRELNVLMPIVGLVYNALLDLYLIINFPLPEYLVFFIPFLIVFIVGTYGVWRRSRVGYIVAVAVIGIWFILNATRTQFGEFANPQDTVSFIAGITALPLSFVSLLYSIAGLLDVWRKVTIPKTMPTIPRASVLALLCIGFILGGLVVGLMAAPTILRLLSAGGAEGDILIPIGSASRNNLPEYYIPATFSIKVGDTVTWVNRDVGDHTVTNTNATVFFDSLNMPVGSTYSYTFTQAGVYPYVCAYHPWMVGKIIVTT